MIPYIKVPRARILSTTLKRPAWLSAMKTMQKEDIRDIPKNLFFEDVCKENNAINYNVRITSGTTKKGPLAIILRSRDHAFPQHRYREDDTRAMAFFGGTNSLLTLLATFFKEAKGSAETLIADPLPEEHMRLIAADYQPTDLYGFPSFIARWLEGIDQADVLQRLRLVWLNGERLNAPMRRFFKAKLSHDPEMLSVYSSSETGYLSESDILECPYNKKREEKNIYHPNQNITIDILNPDADGIGEIAISCMLTNSVRLEKYLIGDMGRFVSEQCPCGHPITYQVLGRKGVDYIKLAGAILRQEEFLRVADELREFIVDFRAEVRTVLQHGRPTGSISMSVLPTARLKQVPSPEVFIAAEFSKRLFLTPKRTLAELVRDGAFTALVVSFATAPFPQKTKEVRVTHIEE